MVRWQDEDVDRYSPTMRRRLLGKRIRAEREQLGWTVAHAAKLLGLDASTLTRYENADRRLTRPVLFLLIDRYELDEPTRRELNALHDQSSARGWFQDFRIPPGVYVDFEAEATQIQSADLSLVPGLLQTEDYARAVMTETAPDATAEQMDAWMKVRLSRAEMLTGPDAPHVWCVIHESALMTVVGNRSTMAAQIRHIAELSESAPRLEVQVLPLSSGQHAAMEGSFSVLTFDELPTLGYMESGVSATWVERQAQITRLQHIHGRLIGQALPGKASVKRLAKLADWMESDGTPFLAEE